MTLDREFIRNATQDIISLAMENGAEGVHLLISESSNTKVDIRNNSVDNVSNSYSNDICLTTYIGNKRGSATLSGNMNLDIIRFIVNKAIESTHITNEDPCVGLPNKSHLYVNSSSDLHLYNPHAIVMHDLIDKAKFIESLALNDSCVNLSDGASICCIENNVTIANSQGFLFEQQSTDYSSSISIIGTDDRGQMQTDYWYSVATDFDSLLAAEELSSTAVMRLKRRLHNGAVATGVYSVIFEANVAQSLFRSYVSAVSGGNLYRKLTFLVNSLGQQIFPSWLDIIDDPTIPYGLSSAHCDTDGVATQRRTVVNNGTIAEYFLSTYSARKLNMLPTGNGDGAHNILVSSNFDGGLLQLISTMGTGLVVVDTMGHGVNLSTGDYSVGASGLWVENGEVKYFVDNITIAGNLRDIYSNIMYIGDDICQSSVRCGSVLVHSMKVTA